MKTVRDSYINRINYFIVKQFRSSNLWIILQISSWHTMIYVVMFSMKNYQPQATRGYFITKLSVTAFLRSSIWTRNWIKDIKYWNKHSVILPLQTLNLAFDKFQFWNFQRFPQTSLSPNSMFVYSGIFYLVLRRLMLTIISCSIICSIFHSSTHSFICSFCHQFIHPLVHAFVH